MQSYNSYLITLPSRTLTVNLGGEKSEVTAVIKLIHITLPSQDTVNIHNPKFHIQFFFCSLTTIIRWIVWSLWGGVTMQAPLPPPPPPTPSSQPHPKTKQNRSSPHYKWFNVAKTKIPPNLSTPTKHYHGDVFAVQLKSTAPVMMRLPASCRAALRPTWKTSRLCMIKHKTVMAW